MTVDPIELELFRNLYEAAAEEMGLTLQRVAFSANIKERRDFSCAIFSARGEPLAQAAHIPVHLGSMPASVAAVIGRIGHLREGDVAIVNDPFAGGTHLPDITVVSPIFEGFRVQGLGFSEEVGGASPTLNPEPRTLNPRLLGYAANRAHHADVGGATPGSMTLSRHIDEEGFRIEPRLLYARGVRDEGLVERFLAAVRTPDERLGDLEAQLAANHVGAAAIARMIARHGVEAAEFYGGALLDYAHAFMMRAIEAIPDGVYRFEDVMDDDGAGAEKIPIRCEVRIEGGRAVVDLTKSADQVAGCINCPEAVTRSAVYHCFACLLEEHVPFNAGLFRDITVLTRPGSILHALYPAAVVAGNTETSQRVVDVVSGALAQALPNRIPAASCGTMSSVALGSGAWTYYETIGGGSGASANSAGASAVQCHMTNTLNTPAEALEIAYPLRVRRFERAQGSGGVGRHVGGDGIVREIEALEACEGTILSDRRATAAWGIGGASGHAGTNSIRRADGTVEAIGGKARFALKAGDVLRIQTPGGGAHG